MRGKGDGYNWYKGALQRYGKFPDAVAAWEELKRHAFLNRRTGYWRIGVRTARSKVYQFGTQMQLHRVVKAYELGRVLKPTECVHHIDGNRANNRPSNLRLFRNHMEHMEEHGALQPQLGTNGVVYAWDPKVKEQRPLARTVMELFLGRRLGSGEVVVHSNGDPKDNRPSNLRVMPRVELCRLNGGKHGRTWKERIEKRAAAREDGLDRLRAGGAAGSLAGGADAGGAAHSDRARGRAA